MSLQQAFQIAPWLFIAFAVLFGLCAGSFLNVVIHRLPKIFTNDWRRQAMEILVEWSQEKNAPAEVQSLSKQLDTLGKPGEKDERYSLIVPGSACPSCGHKITALQNIPLLSYLVLGGKCARCKAPISIRYPLVEALCGILGGYVAWHFGPTWAALWAFVYVWSLIALAFIDQASGYLPDDLTLPLIWLGILVSLKGTYGVDIASSVVGAIAGYSFLWILAKSWGLVRNVEAMGHGDFKLLAAIGAWTGVNMLLSAVLISSFLGAIAGVILMAVTGQGSTAKIRFGPYLSVTGILLLLWGDKVNAILGLSNVVTQLPHLFRGLF